MIRRFVFAALCLVAFSSPAWSYDLAGQWILKVEDKDHKVMTTLTIEFTKEDARGCMSGYWRQVKVISVTGDSKFYPASDALSYEINFDREELAIGRNETCDAYVMLSGSLRNEPISGDYYSMGLRGSNPKGYFTLSRAPR